MLQAPCPCQQRAPWPTRSRLGHLAPSGGHTGALISPAAQPKIQRQEASTALGLAQAHLDLQGEACDALDSPTG